MLVRPRSFVSAHGDSLGKVELELGFITPLELFVIISDQEEMSVTVGQLIVLPLRWIDSRISHLSFRADTNQVHILPKAELFNTRAYSRINNESISSECRTASTSQGFSTRMIRLQALYTYAL